MTKVVIDTNVRVSAVIKEHGAEAAVLDFIATGKLIWYISAPIVAEYQGVLARPKFARLDPERLGRVLKSLARATMVVPTVTRAESPRRPRQSLPGMRRSSRGRVPRDWQHTTFPSSVERHARSERAEVSRGRAIRKVTRARGVIGSASRLH